MKKRIHRRRETRPAWLCLMLIAAGLLPAASGGAAIVNTKLNGPLAGVDEVVDFLISPDGQWVVYRAGKPNMNIPGEPSDEELDLFSVPMDGGPAVRLNGLLPAGRTVKPKYAINTDSRRVVYRAEQDEQGKIELYSVPIEGPSGAGVKLNGVLPPGGSIGSDSELFIQRHFRLSPDGNRVVYRANQESASVYDLYSVPIEGPATAGVKISGPMQGYGIATESFRVSPDGQWVVYAAYQDSTAAELYSVPIDGPSSDALKLNTLLVTGGNVYGPGLDISPDSSRVVYLADQQVDELLEIYSVPIRGPASAGEKLNADLQYGSAVLFFAISPDSQWVAYLADQETQGQRELFGVPIGGTPGGGQRISHTLPTGPYLDGAIYFSPDSRRVVYREWNPNPGIAQIYSTPITGPPTEAVRLNKPLVSGGSVSRYQVAESPGRIVYIADQDTDEVTELYSVPFEGPAEEGIKLNPFLGSGGNVLDFGISADGFQVVYRADRVRLLSGNNIFRLWTVPAVGPATATVLHGSPPVTGGDVSDKFEFAPDGQHIVYIADQDTDNVNELYVSYDQPAAAREWVGYR